MGKEILKQGEESLNNFTETILMTQAVAVISCAIPVIMQKIHDDGLKTVEDDDNTKLLFEKLRMSLQPDKMGEPFKRVYNKILSDLEENILSKQ